jgi:hypothetical protein
MPADPKSLQVVDRIVSVLKNVVAGADYFYTLGDNVIRGTQSFREITSFPYDLVYLASDSQEPEHQLDGTVIKYLSIRVDGYVDGGVEDDSIAMLIKHLRDVERAINEDSKSTAVGSLGQIADYAHVGQAITDEGMMAGDGLAGFSLSVLVAISGEWGEL